MKSLKELVGREKIETINNDLTYKAIAILIVGILIYITYIIFKEGFIKIPGIGGILNSILNTFNDIIAFFSELIWNIIENL